MHSLNAIRFGRSVSGSWCAKCAMRCSSRLRSVMSWTTLMRYCALPSAPATGRRNAVAMRVPLPGVTTVCSSKKPTWPDSSDLRSSASISSALAFASTSPAVLPITAARSTPKYFSAARLIRR